MNEARKNRELGRLRDGSDDPFIRGLLESADDDGPRPGSKAALVASLGIGVGGPLLLGAEAARAAVTTASSIAGGSSVAGAGATVTKSAFAGGYVSLFGKWLAIGVASTTLVMSEASVDESQAESATRASIVAPAPLVSDAALPAGRAGGDALPTGAGDAEAIPAVAVDAAEKPVELAARSKAPRTLAPKAPPAPAEVEVAVAPTDAKGLIDEVRALDDARAALERGDVSKASSTLTDKGSLFARGSLGQEADLLAIEIAAKRGDTDAARALGSAFLAKYPSSPHRGRVESLLRAK